MQLSSSRPTIILLKDGTDTSQGKGQLISNINACQAVADVVRTTLGPRGMDKLIHDGGRATISNDGAEIVKLLDIVHPAAKSMVDIARSQDAQVGDGTTTVVLLSAEFLKQSKSFIEEGMHPMVIIRGYRRACELAVEKIRSMQVPLADDLVATRRDMLEKCAMTALNSKLIARNKVFFAKMIVDAVLCLDDSQNLSMIGVKKVQGGSTTDSVLVRGVAFKKTFAYAGFEQQPKHLENPKVLLLNVELELKSEKENAEIRISDPSKYQSIVDAEWQIIYDKLDQCVAAGATVILSRLPIGDLATQYFADRSIFCAGRVPTSDLQRVATATQARIVTTTNGITDEVIGTCGLFQEKQVGRERYNFFTDCADSQTATFLLRGGAEQFLAESERSVHDAIMIVKRALNSTAIVAGGGAVEMAVSRHLNIEGRRIAGKQQVVVQAFVKALEIIPRQLCDNAGFDSMVIVNQLRKKHAEISADGAVCWYGVDIEREGICDTYESCVWEPAMSKINSISSATEAACLVLSIDETVTNPKSQGGAPPGGMGRGGAPMSKAMGGQGMMGMANQAMGRGMHTMRGRGGK